MLHDLEGADTVVVTVINLFRISVSHPHHGKLHVGLPGAHPYIPDQNIFHPYLTARIIPENHAVRAARFQPLQEDLKIPFLIHGSFILLFQKGDRHSPSRLVKAPDTHSLFLLKHHAVTDQPWQSQFVHIRNSIPFSICDKKSYTYHSGFPWISIGLFVVRIVQLLLIILYGSGLRFFAQVCFMN